MKRRVIYMEDDTWEALRSRAEKDGVTISELIRQAVLGQPSQVAVTMAKSQDEARARAAEKRKRQHDILAKMGKQ